MTPRNRSGKRIKIVRASRDMAQARLCEKLADGHGIKMTQNTLSNIERGQRIVNDIELVSFATIFNVSPLWLLFDYHAPEFDYHPFSFDDDDR